MITFGSLYAGHVDMDDIGYPGMPVNSRRLPDEQLATVFDKAAAIARVLAESGFDVFWLAEHHFQKEGHECIPNIPMLAVHLAHLVEGIRFGCAFNVTPMWHPLRLAEDYAAADIMTGGQAHPRRRARLPHPGGGDLRRPAAGTATPTGICSRSS